MLDELCQLLKNGTRCGDRTRRFLIEDERYSATIRTEHDGDDSRIRTGDFLSDLDLQSNALGHSAISSML